MSGGRITYTKYQFTGDRTIPSEFKYRQFRQINSSELDQRVQIIRKERWAEFLKEHRFEVWGVGIALLSGILTFVHVAFFWISFLLWAISMSCFLSGMQHLAAVSRECHFLRKSYKLANKCESYQDFCDVCTRKLIRK